MLSVLCHKQNPADNEWRQADTVALLHRKLFECIQPHQIMKRPLLAALRHQTASEGEDEGRKGGQRSGWPPGHRHKHISVHNTCE